MHTGLAMGGIIGTVRFHFDMWGPAVLGAAKMEEAGRSGWVIVSDATARMLPASWIIELAQADALLLFPQAPCTHRLNHFVASSSRLAASTHH